MEPDDQKIIEDLIANLLRLYEEQVSSLHRRKEIENILQGSKFLENTIANSQEYDDLLLDEKKSISFKLVKVKYEINHQSWFKPVPYV